MLSDNYRVDMVLWGAVRVTVGATVTLVSSLVVAFSLPVLGLGAAAVVGDGLPVWLFALPLVACPVVGGAIAGVVRRRDRRVDTLLGGVAGAVGVAAVGVLFGLGGLVVVLGLTPNHVADPLTFSEGAPVWAFVGAIAGFVVGAVLGTVGGAGGATLRRKLRG